MRTTILDIQKMKQRGEPITMITAYDYTSAQIIDRTGIPTILVGDTLGNVVQGEQTTLPVTLDDMVYHAKMVVRGSEKALVIGDLPFLTYTSEKQAIASAGRLFQEAGVQAVKLEGGTHMASTVQRLVELGMPVVGHIGFTPQSENQMGRRVQGKQADGARKLIEDARALEEAGAFLVVLELVPAPLASAITERLQIPTIGIGAGPGCDGQVQVWHDLLGLYTDHVPRHARRYATLADTIAAALTQYANDVREGQFPTEEHSVKMKAEALQEALKQIES
ncbi:MAG: 3-methyl-2-oxobutanoate hydroxymethyltransferase [Chloroflexi bacterium AL-W]|nr:3-methyl-2-oxobutanoate hydroxymethyltransferase [Chloroflexi bacterium AL-N1]NOK68850.1 3-methyl-2-oxobutanoate hydroxymethyltransferase [Chloroflexi bacterium AL-N10]NOK76834.1 3-methyl-2-oxobutanoate hydroxymethyltransferase [Chloroflexi bacterium AL-N5]NOK82779.1 3-methyl-2-oxobutanoate hydroxymethyltransferase [Chloroflexi bacterium AL-W]NOK90691.1 3-methyl-2-oxobutanoate hydroxymethyltransferase [Chloroflexi bacterium AL-N15]